MPTLTQSFTVPLPPAEVWDLFRDVPEVAACMPGATLLGEEGPDRYRGMLKVKLGPMSARFEGTVDIVEQDDTARRAKVDARGTDKQGGSRASAAVSYCVVEEGDGARVEIQADISLQGAMAQFGRSGIINDVSARLTEEFARCLRDKLLATSPGEAAKVTATDVSALSLAAVTVRSAARRAVAWLREKVARR